MLAATRKQKSRQKLKEDPVKWAIHLEKERERDKARREKRKLESTKAQLKKKRTADAERQRKCRSKKNQVINENVVDDPLTDLTESPIGTFRTKQSFGKALARSRKVLPRRPCKKKMIVRKLAMEIIPEINNSLKGKKINQHSLRTTTEEKVIQFYNSDAISRQAPGKRDMKSVKEASSGKRILLPKRHMLMTVGEAFAQFKRENKNILIEKSKFYSLRPEHVLLISETPHNVCVCKYHANFDFLLKSLTSVIVDFPASSNDLLNLMCCNAQSERCMIGICEDCQKEANIFVNEDDYKDKCLYKQWKEENGFLKEVEINCSVSDALNELNNQLPFYKLHCFVKATQASYFEEVKNYIEDSEVILQVDFAENYSAVSQDEIQSAHWTHPQITIFTCCAWLKDNNIRSFVVVSDELQHDKYAVWAFLNAILTDLKMEYPQLRRTKIFSDGCVAQFKNKYTISNLCFFQEDFQLICEWNFFATSHGKGAVDGIGGLIKSKVWHQVKSRKVVVNSALDFFNCAMNLSSLKCSSSLKLNISAIKPLYVTSNQILQFKSVLSARWENSLSIEGIQSFHHFQVSNTTDLLIGRTAKSKLKKVTVTATQRVDPSPTQIMQTPDVVLGDYVLVSLSTAVSSKKNSISKFYYATILGINSKKEVSLKYMHPSGPHWIWPEKEDISTENISVINEKVAPPTLVTNRGHYKF